VGNILCNMLLQCVAVPCCVLQWEPQVRDNASSHRVLVPIFMCISVHTYCNSRFILQQCNSRYVLQQSATVDTYCKTYYNTCNSQYTLQHSISRYIQQQCAATVDYTATIGAPIKFTSSVWHIHGISIIHIIYTLKMCT